MAIKDPLSPITEVSDPEREMVVCKIDVFRKVSGLENVRIRDRMGSSLAILIDPIIARVRCRSIRNGLTKEEATVRALIKVCKQRHLIPSALYIIDNVSSKPVILPAARHLDTVTAS
jgi:hypothetical protein